MIFAHPLSTAFMWALLYQIASENHPKQMWTVHLLSFLQFVCCVQHDSVSRRRDITKNKQLGWKLVQNIEHLLQRMV